jgi:hypothetical protein
LRTCLSMPQKSAGGRNKFRAAPHKEARAIDERFCFKLKFEERRDTGCISSSSN